MTNEINNTSVLSQYSLQETVEPTGQQELNQSDFLSLMTTQLKNQSPLDPMDNQAFVGQMAQFSTVGGIAEMVSSMDSLASSLQNNRALDASVLVGRDVLVPSDVGYLTEAGDTLHGSIDTTTDAYTALNIFIRDASGQLINTLSLEPNQGGETRFTWDGLDSSGNPAAAGLYNIFAEGKNTQGNGVGLGTHLYANVDSVSLSGTNNTMTLNLAGLGAAKLSDIKEVG